MMNITFYRRLPAFMIPACILLFLGAAMKPSSAGDIRSEQVRFSKGETGTRTESRIQGREIVDYKVGARAGQRMSVNLTTDNTANYFNILAPGETDAAFFIGSVKGNRFEGILPSNGDYTLRVYLMRSAARRDETANFRLDISITDDETEGSEVSEAGQAENDALVEGSQFNAVGEIPCSMGDGQPTGSCKFGVVREGGGSSLVTVTKPDGRKRIIFFEGGKAIGADTNEADPGEFSAEKQNDLNIIRIGQELYEIPDAVVSGG